MAHLNDFSKTFIFHLRTAARLHFDQNIKVELSHLADAVSQATREFCFTQDEPHLRQLNGVWAHARRFYNSVTFNGSDPSGAKARQEVKQDIQVRKAA